MSKTTKRSVRKRVSKDGDLKALLAAERKARIENESAINHRAMGVAFEVKQLREMIGLLDANIRKIARVVGVPESSLQDLTTNLNSPGGTSVDTNANSAAGTVSSVG